MTAAIQGGRGLEVLRDEARNSNHVRKPTGVMWRKQMRRPFIVGALVAGLVGVMTPFPTAIQSRADAAATAALVTVSQDPFTNPASYHQTAVEPDLLAHGGELVSAFQLGRVFDGGAADIGWATSFDGGRSWSHGV